MNHRELKLLETYFSFGLKEKHLERIKKANSLKYPLMPMEVVLNTPQTPARRDKIFTLQHSLAEGYSITPIEGSSIFNPPLNGRFLFVILSSNPAQIYCGLAYDSINHFLAFESSGSNKSDRGADAMGNVFNSTTRCEVEGHTSLTQCQDVLFAGDMLFNHRTLVSWSNASGHYQPAPDRRHTNLYPNIKKILPESLFSAYDFECLSTGADRQFSSAGSASSRGMSDISSFSSFGSHCSRASNVSDGYNS